jgi:ParB family chromosome partitioning protein
MVGKSIKQVNEDESVGTLDLFAQGALPSGKIDPQRIAPSKWANRDLLSFRGHEWESFKEEILSAGGNIQPIKVRPSVRPANTSPESQCYEIVFGHRRHRACLELGLDVFALVEMVSDRDLFEQMDRENRQRANLTVYEQGEMYKKALDEGLYPSLRKLAEVLGVAPSTMSEAITVAKLPVDVLNVFESRLDIQRRWGKQLTDALLKDPDLILMRANEIVHERKQGKKIGSDEAFKRLMSSKQTTPVTRTVLLPGNSMTVTITGKKASFQFSEMDEAKIKRVEKAIVSALGG